MTRRISTQKLALRLSIIFILNIMILQPKLSQGQSTKEYFKMISNGSLSVPPSKLDTVPVEIINGWIVLDIEIGNKTRRMIWDTGTAFSSIDEIDSNFNKIPNGKVVYNDITKNDNVSDLYQLRDLSLGNFSFQDLVFMVIDTKSAAAGALRGFNGLIGLNIIDKVNWKFNFDEGFVVISPTPFEVDKDFTVRYANYIGYNTLLARLRAPDGKKLKIPVLIDFGVTNSYLFLNSNYKKHFKGSQAEIFKSKKVGISGVGEEETIYILKDSVESEFGPKGQQVTEDIKLMLSDRDGSNVLGSTFFTKYNFVRNSDNSTFTLYKRTKHVTTKTTPLHYGIDFFLDSQKRIKVASISKSLTDISDAIDLKTEVASINDRTGDMFDSNQKLSEYITGELMNQRTLKITTDQDELLLSPSLPTFFTIDRL